MHSDRNAQSMTLNQSYGITDFFCFLPEGNAEEHATLSRALSQLAEVEEKIEQLHVQQVENFD